MNSRTRACGKALRGLISNSSCEALAKGWVGIQTIVGGNQVFLGVFLDDLKKSLSKGKDKKVGRRTP